MSKERPRERNLLRAQLDRVIAIQNSAYDRARSSIQIALKPAALDRDLRRLDERLGRQLPDEVRTLFSWHDGCSVFLVPGVLYRGSEWSIETFESISNIRLPALSNAVGTGQPGTLLPLFDMDRVLLTVALPPEPAGETPLFYLDFEMDQLTMIARSVGAYVLRLLRALEAGNFEVTHHGLRWAHDPTEISPEMTPFG